MRTCPICLEPAGDLLYLRGEMMCELCREDIIQWTLQEEDELRESLEYEQGDEEVPNAE